MKLKHGMTIPENQRKKVIDHKPFFVIIKNCILELDKNNISNIYSTEGGNTERREDTEIYEDLFGSHKSPELRLSVPKFKIVNKNMRYVFIVLFY